MAGRAFYLWQVSPFTVRVSLELIDRLNTVMADPRVRTADEELGGILLGSVLDPKTIQVDGFEIIRSEHRRGAIFALKRRERVAVSQRVAGLNRRSKRAVGFFRTHLRPGLFLDQDDFHLMRGAFDDPSQIALLVRPNTNAPANAGIFLWRDGDMDRRGTPLLFPFNSTMLRTQGPVEESLVPAPVRPAAAAVKPPRAPVRLPSIPKPVLGWTIASVAAVSLIAMTVERGLSVFKPASTSANSGATPRGASPAAHTPPAPLKADPFESVDAEPSAPAPLNADAAQPLESRDFEPAPKPSWRPSTTVYVPAPAPLNAEVAKPSPVSTPAPAAAPEIASNASTPSTAPAPAPESHTPAPEARPVPSVPVPEPTVRNTRAVAVSVRLEPKESGEFRKVVSHVPLFGRALRSDEGIDYSPARPNRAIEPKVPPYLAEDLSRDVAVDLKVSIDKHGAVKNVAVVGSPPQDLALLAVHSAETAAWEPARRGDKFVSSDVILHYRFEATPTNSRGQ